jgi:flavin reductase (DIM6/NTAB) family NADH-FMN oxidoreductase RutF
VRKMEPNKTEISLSNAYKILHPMHTVLVTCRSKSGRTNVITLAWAMPTSIDPPLIAISVKPGRYSHELIEETREFVVNIPTMEIVKETLFCGRRSGRECDKFKEAKLTPALAKAVKAPIIKECIAHLECKLRQSFITGDHRIFVGEVVAAYTDKGCFVEEYDIGKARLVYHLGGNRFATLSEGVIEPSLSP